MPKRIFQKTSTDQQGVIPMLSNLADTPQSSEKFKRSIFQTFWKLQRCTKSLFFKLETSNFGTHVFWWTRPNFAHFSPPHVFWWTQKPHVFWWTQTKIFPFQNLMSFDPLGPLTRFIYAFSISLPSTSSTLEWQF